MLWVKLLLSLVFSFSPLLLLSSAPPFLLFCPIRLSHSHSVCHLVFSPFLSLTVSRSLFSPSPSLYPLSRSISYFFSSFYIPLSLPLSPPPLPLPMDCQQTETHCSLQLCDRFRMHTATSFVFRVCTCDPHTCSTFLDCFYPLTSLHTMLSKYISQRTCLSLFQI